MSSAIAKKHYENGVRLLKAGKFAEAEASMAEAIAQDEAQAEYWLKLGAIWSKQNRYAEAREAYNMAATLQPDNPEILYALGLSHIYMNDLDAAVGNIEKSFVLKPDKAAAKNLGEIFQGMQNYKLAAYYYMKARQLDPHDADVQSKLATSLYNDNDTVSAIVLYSELVAKYPTNINYISSLTEMYRRFNLLTFDALAHKVILICLKTENVKHRNLGSAWASLIMLDPKLESLRAIATAEAPNLENIKSALADDFLTLGLNHLPILDEKAETMLTGIRRTLLLARDQRDEWPKEALTFLSALAVQCWYNDFVFYETPEEITALDSLEAQVKDILSSGGEGGLEDAIIVSLYACYRPLYAVKTSGEKLPLGKTFLYEMKSLIKAQITNPEREAALIPDIPDFTEITDDVSRAVEEMYTKRPYPRWKSASVAPQPQHVAELSRGMSVLVAGCGTGQEPSIYANIMPLARTTAIDLSLPSIAYGKRMAEEIGFAHKIDFLHGDLMDVAKLDKTFDFVVSSGVLHHMKEPEKGWKAILGTLKQGGRMSISLYSRIARDYAFNPAIDFIKQQGLSSSDTDMRTFRKLAMALPDGDPVRRCMRATDFYMLSECNDLLFHIQEHRMTFPIMKAMCENLGLELFHVAMRPSAQKHWAEMYPDTPALDFDKLHAFEEKHPDTFLEMYKLYFRRKGDNSTHPLDQLIRAGAV